MSAKTNRPKVGVGVYIIKDGKFLMGERLSSHGKNTWSPPGGHLEYGESWQECCVRETKEESNLDIENIRLLGVTNDIFDNGKHYITLHFVADWITGEPERAEPDKCLGWQWIDFSSLPDAIFLSNANFLNEFDEKLKSELSKSKK